MGYYCTAEAAAGPRGETCETGRVLTGFQSVGSGYRYYSSELGRWLSMDPIEEKGFASSLLGDGDEEAFLHIDRMGQADPLFVFSENNPISGFDYLGLTASSGGCCGPDVTAALDLTLAAIRNTYDHEWDRRQRWAACTKIYNVLDNRTFGRVAMAWDILPLYDMGRYTLASDIWPGTADGSAPSCEHTVAYHERCYNAGYLNYIMWGVINNLCSRSFGLAGTLFIPPLGHNPWSLTNALAIARLYKGGIQKNRDSLPEVLSAVRAGYRSSGSCIPAISRTECAVSPENRITSQTAFDWVWEPVQKR